MKLVVQNDWDDCLGNAKDQFKSEGKVVRFCGEQSSKLAQLKNLFDDDSVEYYKQLTDFFTFNKGGEDFWNIIKVIIQKKKTNLANTIQHVGNLYEAKKYQA